MFVCTSPAYGVMLPSNGYYPPANEDEDGDAILEDAADFANGVTADAVEGTDRVRNIILGEFVQSLRPHASIMQTELIIAIFEACPELVAPHFDVDRLFILPV
jgi:nucleolar pre-ribosomal-associated protein 1